MFYSVSAVQQNEAAVCVHTHIYIHTCMMMLSFIFLIIYLFLSVLDLHCCMGFSLVAESRGYSLVVVYSGFSCCRARALGCPGFSGGSVVAAPRLECRLKVVAQGFSCFTACGIFPNQGLNPHLLHWQVNSLPSHQGSP